ncbi:MAG TPA: hypothetical protein VLF79_02500 [Candidatus Saccharimonadales bacterium]|nr:hypothetical protein [Candidatus Saccharimonadales bacterium]
MLETQSKDPTPTLKSKVMKAGGVVAVAAALIPATAGALNSSGGERDQSGPQATLKVTADKTGGTPAETLAVTSTPTVSTEITGGASSQTSEVGQNSTSDASIPDNTDYSKVNTGANTDIGLVPGSTGGVPPNPTPDVVQSNGGSQVPIETGDKPYDGSDSVPVGPGEYAPGDGPSTVTTDPGGAQAPVKPISGGTVAP